LKRLELDEIYLLAESKGLSADLFQDYTGYEFYESDGALGFKSPDFAANEKPIFSDLVQHLNNFSKQFNTRGLKKEPLAKAVGGKKTSEIIDSTCGMGQDSMYFLALGHHVMAWERQPLVFLMQKVLVDILKELDPRFSKFSISFGDSSKIVTNCSVIYFDPMYSQHNEKALPNKQMRIFRELVGSDTDELMVAKYLQASTKRLVIKRPIKAVFLIDPPDLSYKGKSTRYDVYLNH
jgi:16S rRNA (guanine1516-N2)-methyltransferase